MKAIEALRVNVENTATDEVMDSISNYKYAGWP